MNDDGYVYGPTPPQIADRIEKWEKLRPAGVEGLPEWPVEHQWIFSGKWVKVDRTAADWLAEPNQDVPRLAIRLVPLPVPPPEPETVVPDPTADTVQQALVRDDAVWMAKLARGSSWPGEMAHNVEQAANRVIAAYGSDADRAAIAALLAGGEAR